MGVIAINKPKGYTSHDIIAILRNVTGIRRIGHAGTLDPLASGVLVVAIGREYTKKINTIMKSEKEYVAEFTFGLESSTDDGEGVKTIINNKKVPDVEEIKKNVQLFIGYIKQVAPQYSAVKVKGKAAYKYARSGQKITLNAKLVEIKSIDILDYAYPILKLKIICGAGVYIRSLARDLGKVLGTGAYVSSLFRRRVGDFILENAVSIEEIKNNPCILDKVG